MSAANLHWLQMQCLSLSMIARVSTHPISLGSRDGSASQYCFQAQANKRFQLRRLGISERSHSPTDESQNPTIVVSQLSIVCRHFLELIGHSRKHYLRLGLQSPALIKEQEM
jgi:hypothetical protein